MGVLLLFFRGSSGRTLLAVALLLLILPLGMQTALTLTADRPPPADPGQEVVAEEAVWPPPIPAALYSDGSLIEIVAHNARQVWEQRKSIVGNIWMLPLLGLFLIGVYIGHRGVLQNGVRRLPLIRRASLCCLALGFLLTLLANHLSSQAVGASPWVALAAGLSGTLGSLALSLSYAGGLVLLFERASWRRRLRPLAAVGRMALTNYLLQTIICTTIFYGFGLGLFGRLGPAASLALTVLVFAAQVSISVWWMRSFRFGPMEWLWRTLTYGQVQSLYVVGANEKKRR